MPNGGMWNRIAEPTGNKRSYRETFPGCQADPAWRGAPPLLSLAKWLPVFSAKIWTR